MRLKKGHVLLQQSLKAKKLTMRKHIIFARRVLIMKMNLRLVKWRMGTF